jgi:predicted HAD superfamily phosphohydrolase YqeG
MACIPSDRASKEAAMSHALCFDLYETLVTEAGVCKPRKEAWVARLAREGIGIETLASLQARAQLARAALRAALAEHEGRPVG